MSSSSSPSFALFDLPWRPWYTQSIGEGGGVGSSPDSSSSPSDDDDVPLLERYALFATLAFTMFVYAFECYLDDRQRKSYKIQEFPKELEDTVGKIDADRASASASEKKKEEETKEKEEEDPSKKKKDDEDETKKEEDGKAGKAPSSSSDGKKEDEESTPPPPPLTSESENAGTASPRPSPDAQKEADDEKKKVEKKAEADDDGKKEDRIDSHKPLLPQLRTKFSSSQSYGTDKIHFGMVSSAYDVSEATIFLTLGFLPYAWDAASKMGTEWFGYDERENEIKVTLIFLAGVTAVGTITSLPFELYSTFRIEKKHGFNKQTPKLFFTDKVKSLALTFAIGGPFVALLLTIIEKGGDNFFLYVWAFLFVFSVFMMTIVPVFIMPLFNKYEPLQEGDLKRRIYELAEQLKYPLTKLFVMDGSRRSSHSNAFMFGFGKNKRIVLFDTLLEQVLDDEILAILGHELGHWKLGHTLTNFVVTQLYFGASFYAFSLCYGSDDLHRAFGFDAAGEGRTTPTIVALMIFFQSLWAPVDKILSFLLTMFSRRCEFQADKFSVDLGMSDKLQSGLCKIHLENLGAMRPDRLYSTYHYSHPPLVERLSAMMELDKKTK